METFIINIAPINSNYTCTVITTKDGEQQPTVRKALTSEQVEQILTIINSGN
jgi:hypothetical protein